MIKLYDYQTDICDNVSKAYGQGVKKILIQLATGGGKTIIFSSIIQRYLQKYKDHKCIVLVDRVELLDQSVKTLYNKFGIIASKIEAGNKNVNYNNHAFVGMVETFYNKLKSNKFYAQQFNLLIIDECHVGNFTKIYEYFNGFTIGVTATPIAAKKTTPLKNYFDRIITGPQINDLIGLSLVQNITYSDANNKNVSFSIKRGEYDEKEMSNYYSTSRNVTNTVDFFKSHGTGKTIVFNCNVEHSLLVNAAFNEDGFNSKHVDANSQNRDEIFNWFKHTENAILNNVGIATKGFDEPSINTVIVNKKTLSLSLWLQMCGRGSRKHINKDHFTILDLGGNAYDLGDWNANRDWNDIFYNPQKPSKGGGVAPIKECDGCEAIIPAQSLTCIFCGHVHSRKIEYDREVDLKMITENIDINRYTNINKMKGYKPSKTFFDILERQIAITKDINISFDAQLVLLKSHTKNWLNSENKKMTSWWSEFAEEQLRKKLEL